MIEEGSERQIETSDALRRLEPDCLVLEAADAINTAMREAGVTRADLARMLGTSRATSPLS